MDLQQKKDALDAVTQVVGYASIVSAAMFGLIGLFTEYKKEGRPTFWGKAAAVGIALSAAFGLSSAFLQQSAQATQRDIDRGKAEEEKRETRRRYETQLDNLAALGLGVSQVSLGNQKLLGQTAQSLEANRRSLVGQQKLLANARKSLLLTAGLSVRQRAGTLSVLRNLWDDVNRIGTDSLEMLVRYDCPRKAGAVLPALFGQDTVGDIHIGTGEAQQFYLLRSLNVTQARMDPFGAHENHPEYVLTLDNFFGSNLEALADPEAWRGKALDFYIFGNFQGSVSDLKSALSRDMLGPDAVSKSFNTVQQRDIVAVLPCPVNVRLFINGRQVVSAEGTYPVLFQRGDRQRVMIHTEVVRIAEDAFPRFVARR